MSPSAPRTPPGPTTVSPNGRTPSTGDASQQNRPTYGVVEYGNGFGFRFVGHDLTETQCAALCATARDVGCRPADTKHFLTESKSH